MEFSNLTNVEFVEILNKNGFNVSSINSAQRPLYEKRLSKKLLAYGDFEEVNIVSDENVVRECPRQLEEKFSKEVQYFAVQIPDLKLPEASKIFTDFKQAKIFCKDYSNARFKVFKDLKNAEIFTKEICSESIKPEQTLSLEGCAFPSIKYEDIFKMKRYIEEGNVLEVEQHFYLNPRYLISSGDTPTIYQEGSRYNALHLASFKNQPNVCALVINTLSDNLFLKLMYPNDTELMREDRKRNIIDLYLNMPDKALNETALHFASKFGFTEVVKILVAHPLLDKMLKNKYNETALDIVCSRVKCGSQKDKLAQIIITAFEGDFYTVILRNEDEPATLSAVISHHELTGLSPLASPFPKNKPPFGSPTRCQPIDDNVTPQRTNILLTPMRVTPNEMQRTLSNKKHVAAVVGPLPLREMESFHKLVVSCGRTPDEKKNFSSVKRSDCRKGIERVCRELAYKENIKWSEYWEFLGCQVDLQTTEGLSLFEDHLQKFREKFVSAQYDKYHHFDSSLLNSSLTESTSASDDINSSNNQKKIFNADNIINDTKLRDSAELRDDIDNLIDSSENRITTDKICESINSENLSNFSNIQTFNKMKCSESRASSYIPNCNIGYDKSDLNSIKSSSHLKYSDINKPEDEVNSLKASNSSNDESNFINNKLNILKSSKNSNCDTVDFESPSGDNLNDKSTSSLGDLCRLLEDMSIVSDSSLNETKLEKYLVDKQDDNDRLTETAKANFDLNDDDNDDFITAVETSSAGSYEDDNDCFFDTSDILIEEKDIFINGDEEPSIFDAEAYLALQFVNENKLISFPNVKAWLNKMRSLNIQDIKRKPNNIVTNLNSKSKISKSQLEDSIHADLLDFKPVKLF